MVSKQDPDPYKKGLDPQTSCESETRIVDMDPLGSEIREIICMLGPGSVTKRWNWIQKKFFFQTEIYVAF